MRPVLSTKKIRKIGQASVIRGSYTRSGSGGSGSFVTAGLVVVPVDGAGTYTAILPPLPSE